MQVGDHRTALELFVSPPSSEEHVAYSRVQAARAFHQMKYVKRRKVPQYLYKRVIEDLGCASRECENPAHAHVRLS